MSAAMEDEIDLLPIAILIDELRHEAVNTRLHSIKKLDMISQALGPARTRDELIPYLGEFVDDEDEILLALSEELPKLVQAVGGPIYAHVLLPTLENLAQVEENSVRDQALQGLHQVSTLLSESAITEYMFPLVQRLATNEWFTARIASCSLFTGIYSKCQPVIQEQLRSLFTYLCRDETPMVRRAACSHLGKFAACADHAHVSTDFVAALTSLCQDEQDSVRVLIVDNIVALARLLSQQETVTLLGPCIRNTNDDSAWRVRYTVATHFVDLCRAVGPETTAAEMLEGFLRLLRDPEAEVRTAAAANVTEMSKLLGPVLSQQLLPCLRDLVNDASQFTRASLAAVIMGMASVLHKDDVFQHLLPLFLTLLKDSHPDVRLNIISKLDALNQVIGLDLLSQSLLPAILDLSSDKKWRIRLAIIELIPSLAQQLGVDFFEGKLADLCLSWLSDSVFSIREAATHNLGEVSRVFGAEWSQAKIVPRIANVAVHSNYLFRMTAIHAIKELSTLFTPEGSSTHLLPIAFQLAKDPVPNIRFNVAKMFGTFIANLNADAIQSRVKPCLQVLAQDSDDDVRFFAQQSLVACK